MPYPISDKAANLLSYNKVYERATVIHNKTDDTIRVADGISAYNDLKPLRSRVEVETVVANGIYAGPVSGPRQAPAFRSMVPADLGAATGASKVLTLDGSGGMDWQTPAGGGLAVNSTPITGGTVGRVLFEGAGNVLQQAAGFSYDFANIRVDLGGVGSPLGRLSILSPASTGLALQIRNSLNTGNQLTVDGNGAMSLQNTANGNGLHWFNAGSGGSGYWWGSASTFTSGNHYMKVAPGLIGFATLIGSDIPGIYYRFLGSATGNIFQENSSNRFRLTANVWNDGQYEFINGNLSLQDVNAQRPAGTARRVFTSTIGTPSNSITDTAQLLALDVTGSAGKAWWHARGEHTGNTDNIIIGGIVYKTTTGNPSYNHEGLYCINTFDLTFSIYANGAWRVIITL